MENLWQNQFLGVNLGAEIKYLSQYMKITNATKESIVPLIIGDELLWKSRTGRELVTFFQNFGFILKKYRKFSLFMR